MTWRVDWDNGPACGTFPQRFDTEAEAEIFAKNWKEEMVALDTNPEEAEEAYSYEIVEEP